MNKPNINELDKAELDKIVDYLISQPKHGWPGIKKFDLPANKTLTVNLTEMAGGTIKDLTREETDIVPIIWNALEAWSIITGITFEETEEDDAHITFIHEINSARASLPINNKSKVTIDKESTSHKTILHEIGHALGLLDLRQPQTEVIGEYHSRLTTVLSNRLANPFKDHETVITDSGTSLTESITTQQHSITPQIADILAMWELYGQPDSVQARNTTYGIGSDTGTFLDDVFAKVLERDIPASITLYDTGGYDTLDLSTDSTDQDINLNPYHVSYFHPISFNDRNTIIIAPDTYIERYIAGSGNDYIVGNKVNNTLKGRNGSDLLEGGPGADTLDGGSGEDTASYKSSSAGVLVRLHDARAVRFGDAEGDTLIDIEHLTGSAHNDILAGDGGDNILTGSDGDDVLYGGPADSKNRPFGGNHDTLYGGDGDDRLFGGEGNDRLYGEEGNDVLRGGPGADWLYADGNDMDVLHGGPGYDRFKFYPGNLGGGTIQDFTDGEDKISLTAFDDIRSIDDLDITPIGDNVHIELAGEDYLTMIILSDFDVNNLDNSDFIFVA